MTAWLHIIGVGERGPSELPASFKLLLNYAETVIGPARFLADLEPVLVEGAKASRFTGKAGQVFEGFVERDGRVLRIVLAGIGAPSAKDRRTAIEKAGAPSLPGI